MNNYIQFEMKMSKNYKFNHKNIKIIIFSIKRKLNEEKVQKVVNLYLVQLGLHVAR